MIDIGAAHGSPRLGSSKVTLHSKVSDPAKLAALRALVATFRSVVERSKPRAGASRGKILKLKKVPCSENNIPSFYVGYRTDETYELDLPCANQRSLLR